MDSWEVVRFIHRIGSPLKATVIGCDEYERVLLETSTDYKSVLVSYNVEDSRSQDVYKIGETIDTVVFNCVDKILYLSDNPIDTSKQSIEEWKTYYDFIDTLEIGTSVRGIVTASKAFGLFIDIGAPYIGLIDIGHDSFNGGDSLPDYSLWPDVGEEVTCQISYFRLHNQQIGLGWIPL